MVPRLKRRAFHTDLNLLDAFHTKIVFLIERSGHPFEVSCDVNICDTARPHLDPSAMHVLHRALNYVRGRSKEIAPRNRIQLTVCISDTALQCPGLGDFVHILKIQQQAPKRAGNVSNGNTHHFIE